MAHMTTNIAFYPVLRVAFRPKIRLPPVFHFPKRAMRIGKRSALRCCFHYFSNKEKADVILYLVQLKRCASK